MEGPSGMQYIKPKAMFQTLRRLHGHNLESKGLNNLSEAFQHFITRARFFSIGHLRRTWSHSAVEFMKYRRLLPMLVADESDPGCSLFDDFDIKSGLSLSFKDSLEDRRVTVSNISHRVTSSQLQSFMGKFGKVQTCHIPSEDRRATFYGTLPKNPKKFSIAHITFKSEEAALNAKTAPPEELTFYGQVMIVRSYAPRPKRRETTPVQVGLGIGIGSIVTKPIEDNLSRSSSSLSLASSGTLTSMSSERIGGIVFEELPPRALEKIFSYLPPVDRIKLERLNKTCLEAAAKSWTETTSLSFAADSQLCQRFGKTNPLRNMHLKAFLLRCGIHLRSLDFANSIHLLDDKALEYVSQLCPELEELDVSSVRASATALHQLSDSLPKLKTIAYREMSNMNDKSFWYLFKSNGMNLKHIDLRGCSRLKGGCFKNFGVNLEEVFLDGCTRIGDEAIEELCLRSGNIRVLKLNGCNQITDQSVSMISRHLLDLEVLAIGGDKFSKLTTDGLMSLTNCKNLKSLSFDFNSLCTSELIEAIVKNIPTIERLSIAFAGTDTLLDEKALSSLEQLKFLQELDISGIAQVTNNVLSVISGGCQELRELRARSCIYLGDAGVSSLEKLPNLEHVDLSGCLLVTSKSIQFLANSFKTDDKTIENPITINAGGTVCEPNQIRLRSTRIIVDFNDYTALGNTNQWFNDGKNDEEDLSDDEFSALATHRSFIVDALNVEDDDSPLSDEKSMLEWAQKAEKEAANLGLVLPKKK